MEDKEEWRKFKDIILEATREVCRVIKTLRIGGGNSSVDFRMLES